ncbi:unnamed protein product, partial [marine sediment metagenome]
EQHDQINLTAAQSFSLGSLVIEKDEFNSFKQVSYSPEDRLVVEANEDYFLPNQP